MEVGRVGIRAAYVSSVPGYYKIEDLLGKEDLPAIKEEMKEFLSQALGFLKLKANYRNR